MILTAALVLALPWYQADVIAAPQTVAPVCIEFCTNDTTQGE